MNKPKVKEIDCFLEFQMNSLKEILVYRVRPEAWRRIQEILEQERNPEDKFIFFSFNTRDGRDVSISVNDIQAVRYTLTRDTGYSDKKNFENKVTLFYRNRLEPITMGLLDDADATNLASSVLGGSVEQPFISFLDGDGNNYTFSLDYLVVMELSTSQLEKQYEEEEEK